MSELGYVGFCGGGSPFVLWTFPSRGGGSWSLVWHPMKCVGVGWNGRWSLVGYRLIGSVRCRCFMRGELKVESELDDLQIGDRTMFPNCCMQRSACYYCTSDLAEVQQKKLEEETMLNIFIRIGFTVVMQVR